MQTNRFLKAITIRISMIKARLHAGCSSIHVKENRKETSRGFDCICHLITIYNHFLYI